jgi:hypothetical protein
MILALIALAFFGPMALAMWMYFSGQDVELGANHGALLEPIVNVYDTLPDSGLADVSDVPWRLIYKNTDDCGQPCRQALYLSRQSRTMLGREMDRVARVFLHGPALPDTLFLESEHADLLLLSDQALSELLASKTPGDLSSGGYYLVDPIGNLVLYFPPEIDPKAMVSDIKRLLRISQIG